jgi:hypothetical protein
MRKLGRSGVPLYRRGRDTLWVRHHLLPLSFAALGTLAGSSCRSTEQELAERFMEASARGESQTVALLSMVAFPEDVRSWRVLGITSPTREPYRVPALRQRVAEAEEKRDEQFKAFGEFRNRNYDDLAEIQRVLRDDPEARFTGHLEELQREWEAFREERRSVVGSLHDAQRDLEREVRQVTKSIQRESTPEYLTGEALQEQARVMVTTSGGTDRLYVLVLTRYELQNQFGAVVPTRWIITDITPEAL